MMRSIKASVGLFAEVFDPPGPVVELGSFYAPGYDWLCNLRPYFRKHEYIGCDLRMGDGVDRIEDAQQLSFEDESVGTVLMLEILEHLPDPQAAIAEARRILRDDGLVAISTPFNYGLHAFPDDYWRFTPSGMHRLLEDFSDKVVFALGPRAKPAFVFAVAAKRHSAAFEERRHSFQQRIEERFRRTRRQGYTSVLRRTGRDLVSCALGRAELGAAFFDPSVAGGYFERTAAGRPITEMESSTR